MGLSWSWRAHLMSMSWSSIRRIDLGCVKNIEIAVGQDVALDSDIKSSLDELRSSVIVGTPIVYVWSYNLPQQ